MSIPTLSELFANVRGMIAYFPAGASRLANSRIQDGMLHIFDNEGKFSTQFSLDTPYRIDGSILTFDEVAYAYRHLPCTFRLLMDFVDMTSNHMAPKEPVYKKHIVFYLPVIHDPPHQRHQLAKIHQVWRFGQGTELTELNTNLIKPGLIYKIIKVEDKSNMQKDLFEYQIDKLIGRTSAYALMSSEYLEVINYDASNIAELAIKPEKAFHPYNPARISLCVFH